MTFAFPVLAAFGCALCNGLSAVLQKTGADSVQRATSLHPGIMWRLSRNIPYIMGLAVDGVAWMLTMFAVHYLPLFLVQPITGLSIIVTVLIEWLVFRKIFHPRTLAAIALVLAGLGLIAAQATVQTVAKVPEAGYWAIIWAPALLLLLGAPLAAMRNHSATVGLAALSGAAFGGTAITGRMLMPVPPYWHLVYEPVFLSLVAYGLIGVLLFTIALQRHHASTVNAAMIAFETIVPTAIGLTLLGDRPKNGSLILIITGIVTALAGILAVIASQTDTLDQPDQTA